MSCLTEDRASQPLVTQPHVYVRTLGGFSIEVNKQLVSCRRPGIGAPQMRLPLGYLIARCDQPICRETLIEIARRYSDHPPRHVYAALIGLLKSWGMADALRIDDASMMLRRHPIWGTDTDALQQLWDMAIALHTAGEHMQALVTLQRARRLCGGKYMPFYDALPDYTITGEVNYWQDVQKNVLLEFARMHLDLTQPYPCAEAQWAAGRAVAIDLWNPATCLAAADIARQCGNEASARFYEQKANDPYGPASKN